MNHVFNNGGIRPIQVTTGEVLDTAQQCHTTADEIQAELGALKAYVIDLEFQWHGLASQTFTALMADWDIYSAMLNQALMGIGDGLRGNWHNYSESELSNINNLRAVNGGLPSLPGARLK